MNKVLQLKGPFQGRRHPKAVVVPTLQKGDVVEYQHLERLEKQLHDIKLFWSENAYLDGALISAHYKRVVPKTRRIQYLFQGEGKNTSDCICGARFENGDAELNEEYVQRHVFTYFVSLSVLEKAIERIRLCKNVLDKQFGGKVTAEDINLINNGTIKITIEGVAKSIFTNTVVDCNAVLYFAIDKNEQNTDERSLITLYKTNTSIITLLRRIGIDINADKLLDDCTVSLRPDQIRLLKDKAPYFISMVNDFSKYAVDIPDTCVPCEKTIIPPPRDEPVIGVIDTRFDKRCYFSDWVEYTDLLNPELGDEQEDYFHGTAVSSLIVDGPAINPELEDGCGRFRVRHFAVAKPNGSSSFTILKSIQGIIKNNRDIKVWNLSLGSVLEINENFVSPEAYFLDEIQCENDVIFVVAGTNDSKKTMKKRLGAPADSLNSLVVNAVDCENKEASYSRKGPVLNFFYKPDVACFGGDSNGRIRVCGPQGEATVAGTSFAAPWVSRKVAFLIHKMGLTREVAKALIIDAAAGWEPQDKKGYYLGYGVIPTHINDILKTSDDEIRFVLSNTIHDYETFTYSLPVPIINGMQPFWSRATMTYFPVCDRNQGVDYTCTEMDLHFGRVCKNSKGQVLLKEIDDNKQASDTKVGIPEAAAREMYRKWDNVKRISEKVKRVARPKKVYEAGMWGIRVVTKERGNVKLGQGTPFGVVVTLKEMNGENRIEDFIRLCGLYGWLVSTIDVDAKLDLYNRINEEIEWE